MNNPSGSGPAHDPKGGQLPLDLEAFEQNLQNQSSYLNVFGNSLNSAQQKRQNSMSAYMANPSSKRTPNPLQMQLLMQSNVPGATQLGTGEPGLPSGRFVPVAQRGKYRKSVQFPALQIQLQQLLQQRQGVQLIKTPTPSNYEVPSSPNVTQSTAQNNSDLSGSSPMVDSLTPGTTAQNKDSASSHSQQNASIPLQQQPSVQSEALNTAQQRVMTDEEQQLATKLKETYKNIVSFEEIVQKSIVELTHKINQSSNFYSSYSTSMYVPQHQALQGSAPNFQAAFSTNTTELSNNLWTIYHHNITLLNNYYDFLTTALKPTAISTHHRTGKNIIDLYKIPRRMWVYGIVGFLELLKNIMSIFQEHEVFSCFIAHCFSIVSSLTDPSWEMEGWWCEKLGDLSRMAIALYSSRFIDWKSSSEYWYWNALKTLYGHGKMYYHMSTVQQDNLEALVNISKAVNCRDPFVPTAQYLELVVENICTQRNILSLLELPIIDFIKIHKVLLCINTNNPNSRLSPNQGDVFQESRFNHGIDLVSRYAMSFGSDSHGYNFFLRQFIYLTQSDKQNSDPFSQYLKQQHEQDQQSNSMDTIEKVNFWFNKGPLFAIANINHLIGFGDAKNPFAKLFLLPEALRERKDKKERKRKTKSNASQESSQFGSISNGVDSLSVTGSDLSVMDWFYCLAYLDKSVLELNFRILRYYLVGPKQASACHIIVWLYFLIALGEAIKRFPESRNMFLWLFQKFFPWEPFINYMNSITNIVCGNTVLNNMCRDYLINHPNYVQYFNENEHLPEVWKCWGTLWFDFICVKQDYEDYHSAGILSHEMFDLPICGTTPMVNLNNLPQDDDKPRDRATKDNEERLVRIVLLARLLADNYEFGFMRDKDGFKFDGNVYEASQKDMLLSFPAYKGSNDMYQFINEVIYEDTRLTLGGFVTPISPSNLGQRSADEPYSAESLDESWFQMTGSSWLNGNDDIDFGPGISDQAVSEEDADIESNENGIELDSTGQSGHLNDHHIYHLLQHQQALMLQQRGDSRGYYNGNFVIDDDLVPSLKKNSVDGDLGDRMDTSLTYITFDTNIWLKHCGRIFKCAHGGAFKVLIPLIVFQELRSLRKSTEATIADAATRSVIIIRELYANREAVPLRFDGTVASDINEVTEFENNPSWLNNVDLTVLNVVTEHDEINRKLCKGLNSTLRTNPPVILDEAMAKVFRYCILITDDRNMRLRAKTTGLSSFQSRWLFGQLEAISSNMCID